MYCNQHDPWMMADTALPRILLEILLPVTNRHAPDAPDARKPEYMGARRPA